MENSVARAPQGLSFLREHPEDGVIVMQAVAVDSAPPDCPACGKSMAKHGRHVHRYADTPIHGVPVRLEVERPAFAAHSAAELPQESSCRWTVGDV